MSAPVTVITGATNGLGLVTARDLARAAANASSFGSSACFAVASRRPIVATRSGLPGAARTAGEYDDSGRWIEADITRWQPDSTYDAWHDRAVLHFLTTDSDRAAYLHALRRAVRPGGIVYLAALRLLGEHLAPRLAP